jgi:hypothetical protein
VLYAIDKVGKLTAEDEELRETVAQLLIELQGLDGS